MRTSAGACLAVALVALLAAPVQGFPIGSQDYNASVPFVGGVDSLSSATFLSGSIDATTAPSKGAFVFLNTTGFSVAGLTQVCWTPTTGLALPECATGNALRIDAPAGATFGMEYPKEVGLQVESRHSFAFFVDVGRTLDFVGHKVTLGRDLAAVHVGGRVTFPALPALPATAQQDLSPSNSAGLALLDARGHLLLVDGAHSRTLNGPLALTMQGLPAIAPFAATATLVPFMPGSTARFAPADADAAKVGVDLAHVQGMANDLQQALGGKQQTSSPSSSPPKANPLQPVLSAILGGALLRPPANLTQLDIGAGNLTSIAHGITLLRFDSMMATAASDGSVALAGGGPLQITGGRVVGAPSLLGIMPWWCWVLWVAALGMWVARLVVKPAKENEQWDKLRWVGWVAGPVMSILVFWLWDGQVYKVWGLSFLRGTGGAVGMGLLLVMEALIGLIIYLVLVMPLSSLLKSGARFAKQGRFMGLNKPVAMLLGFLLGSTLLLSYMDFMIRLLG